MSSHIISELRAHLRRNSEVRSNTATVQTKHNQFKILRSTKIAGSSNGA